MNSVFGVTVTILGLVASVMTISDWLAKRAAKEAHEDAGRPKFRLWTIDRTRVSAMIVGAAVYVVLSHFETGSIGPLLLISFPVAVAAVAGVWYGPWAGLFTGAVGYVSTIILVPVGAGYTPFPPAFSVGDGIAGVVGGLVCLYRITGQPKAGPGSAVVGTLIGAFGVLLGDVVAYGFLQHQHIAPSSGVFSNGLRSDVLCTAILVLAAQLFQPMNSIGALAKKDGAGPEAAKGAGPDSGPAGPDSAGPSSQETR